MFWRMTGFTQASPVSLSVFLDVVSLSSFCYLLGLSPSYRPLRYDLVFPTAFVLYWKFGLHVMFLSLPLLLYI